MQQHLSMGGLLPLFPVFSVCLFFNISPTLAALIPWAHLWSRGSLRAAFAVLACTGARLRREPGAGLPWCWASLLPCAERAGAAGELGQRAGSRTRSRFSVRRHAPGPSLIGKVSSERLQLFKLIWLDPLLYPIPSPTAWPTTSWSF